MISVFRKFFISSNFLKKFLLLRIVKKIISEEYIKIGILLIPKNIVIKDINPSNNCEKGKAVNNAAYIIFSFKIFFLGNNIIVETKISKKKTFKNPFFICKRIILF